MSDAILSDVGPSAPPLAPRKAPHIPSLDGLRAVAIGIVFVSHAGYENRVPGLLGVAGFFFLSGYLITTLLRLEFLNTERVNFRNFYLRRVLRIFPPLYLTLAAIALGHALGLLPGPMDAANFVTGALFLQNYNPQFHIVGMADMGPLWSLAVEEHFYLVFPAAYYFLLARRPGSSQAGWLALACLAVLAWRCVEVFALRQTDFTVWRRTDNSIDGILFGCIMALWCNPVMPEDAARRWPKWSWLGGVGLLLVCLVVRSDAFRDSIRFTLEGVAFMPIFYCAITQADRWPFKLLNSRAFTVVGLGSYSIYLVHLALMRGIEPWPSVKSFLLAATLCGLWALCMYKLVERPCARLRRRLSATA